MAQRKGKNSASLEHGSFTEEDLVMFSVGLITVFPDSFREDRQCRQKKKFCNCTGITRTQYVQETRSCLVCLETTFKGRGGER